MMYKLTLFWICLLLPCYGFSQQTWVPTSQDISFKIKNAGIAVNGTFDGWRSELVFSPDKLGTSSLKSTIQVSSIKTGIGLRDEHLKGETYFHADSFKAIQVVSAKLYLKGNDYAGLFHVTIKGVTKDIEIPFQFNQLADEAEFKGSFVLNRRDFGVGGKSLTMSDEVTVTIEIKAKLLK